MMQLAKPTVKLTKEGLEKLPHFSGNVWIVLEDDERYRIRAKDNRKAWVPKSFIETDKPKKKRKKKEESPDERTDNVQVQ